MNKIVNKSRRLSQLKRVMEHQPVLVEEILKNAESVKNPKWALDLTFGCGGHSLAFKKKFSSIKIMAFDQDPLAVKQARQTITDKSNIFIYHANFHHFEDHKKSLFDSHSIQGGFDLIILDLGVNSAQLGDPQRGFSFYHDGPLDMRMDTTQTDGFSASDILNQWSADQLFRLFQQKGEIRNPRSVIHSLIRYRKKQPVQSTKQFAELIIKSIGWRKKGRHPATNYFLALRMEVNNELDGLSQSLPSITASLSEGGRIFVLTFHSLEDRIVKNEFKKFCLNKEGFLVNKKVIRPSRKEIQENNNSRSAKLRIFQKMKR